jgi:hypothetical protein
LSLEPDNRTPFEVEHQRYNELFQMYQKLALEKAQLAMELDFLKKALLEKPVIATLTDDQCQNLGKAIVYFLQDEIKKLINSGKPLVN